MPNINVIRRQKSLAKRDDEQISEIRSRVASRRREQRETGAATATASRTNDRGNSSDDDDDHRSDDHTTVRDSSSPASLTAATAASGSKRRQNAHKTAAAAAAGAGQERTDADAALPPSANRLLCYFLLCLVLAVGFSTWRYLSLPTPLEASAPNAAFSEERALTYVAQLSQSIGIRNAASANANKTVEFLLAELEKISGMVSLGTRLTYQVQTINGDFVEPIFGVPQRYIYTDVKNVVAKLTFARGRDRSNILLNAHYDSNIRCPGAADNALSVAMALEILRNLASGERLNQNLIVLFNGAEEWGLLGAHGFLKHYAEGKIDLALNLEAAGTAGKEMLFQVGPRHENFLLNLYASVPRPHAQAVAQDIFSLVPSDTDFRIFVNHGNLSGTDMAITRNGYLYHTPLDTLENIQPGTAQHYGENVLAYLRLLLNVDHLDQVLAGNAKHATVRHVFFDLFGLFLFFYSVKTVWLVSLLCVLVLGLLYLIEFRPNSFMQHLDKASVRQLLLFSLGSFLSLVVSLICSFLAAWVFSVVVGKPLSYFSSTWLAILLYAPFSVLGIFLVQDVLLNRLVRRLSRTATAAAMEPGWLEGMICEHASTWGSVLVPNLVFLFGSLFLGLRCAYLFFIPVVLFTALRVMSVTAYGMEVFMANREAARQGARASASASAIPLSPISTTDIFTLALLSAVPVSAFWNYTALHLLDLFIPLTGRFGYASHGDFMVAVMVACLTYFVLSPLLPLYHRSSFGRDTASAALSKENRSSRHGLQRLLLWAGLLLACGLSCAAVFSQGMTFTRLTPKRVYASIVNENVVSLALLDPRQAAVVTDGLVMSPSPVNKDWWALYPASRRFRVFEAPLPQPIRLGKAPKLKLGHVLSPSTTVADGGKGGVHQRMLDVVVDKMSDSAMCTIRVFRLNPSPSVEDNDSARSAEQQRVQWIRQVGSRKFSVQVPIPGTEEDDVIVDVVVMHLEEVFPLEAVVPHPELDWVAYMGVHTYTSTGSVRLTAAGSMLS